jgi:hypothetical protein
MFWHMTTQPTTAIMEPPQSCVVKIPSSQQSLLGQSYKAAEELNPPFLLEIKECVYLLVLVTDKVLLNWKGFVVGKRSHPFYGKFIPMSELYTSPYDAERVLKLCGRIGDTFVRVSFSRCNPFGLTTCFTLSNPQRHIATTENVKHMFREAKKFHLVAMVTESGPKPPITWQRLMKNKDFGTLSEKRESIRKRAEETAQRRADLRRYSPPPLLITKDIKMDVKAARDMLAMSQDRGGSVKSCLDPDNPITTKEMRTLLSATLLTTDVDRAWLPKFKEVLRVEETRFCEAFLMKFKDHRDMISTVWVPSAPVIHLTTTLQTRLKISEDDELFINANDLETAVVTRLNPTPPPRKTKMV